jgi:hypothetical protein
MKAWVVAIAAVGSFAICIFIVLGAYVIAGETLTKLNERASPPPTDATPQMPTGTAPAAI